MFCVLGVCLVWRGRYISLSTYYAFKLKRTVSFFSPGNGWVSTTDVDEWLVFDEDRQMFSYSGSMFSELFSRVEQGESSNSHMFRMKGVVLAKRMESSFEARFGPMVQRGQEGDYLIQDTSEGENQW